MAEPRRRAEAGSSPRREWLYVLAIVVLWAAVYIPGLFRPALLDDADSVHAEAAREMVQRGDWVTLYVNGFRYLEKAPLMYWGMAASFKVLGVSEAAARLPLALTVLALMFALYWLGRWAYGARAGLYAAVIIATGFGPYIFSRILIPDIIVALLLTLSFGFFLHSLEEDPPSRLTCWGFAVACALNVLTKGLIGLVFPFGAIGLYLLLTGNLRHLLRLRLFSSTLVFVAVTAPWHILAAIRNPAAGQARGFLWFYFVNEHFLRFLNKREPRDYDTVPLLVFWILALVWVFPWSAYIVQALRQVPHRWRELRSRIDRRQRATLLLVLWPLVIMTFFSFSTSQEYYNLPALPGLALLIGAWLARDAEMGDLAKARGVRIATTMLFAIGVIAFVIAMVLLREAHAPVAAADLAELLKKNPDKYALSFGHFFDLTPEALGMFRVPLLVTALALLLGTGGNWWLRRRGRAGDGNVALALMMVAVLYSVHLAFITFNPVLTSKPLADIVQKQIRDGDIIVLNGEYEFGSTVAFYTRRQVHILNSRGIGNLHYGSLFPDSPRIFEDDASFTRLWNSQQRVFFWGEEEKLPRTLLQSLKTYELGRSGGKLLLSNRK